MKPRTLLILTILVVGLGAFIAFYERDLPSSEEREQAAKRLLGTLEAEQVEAVTLQWGDQRVVLERQTPEEGSKEEGPTKEGGEPEDALGAPAGPPKAGWRLTEPFQSRADTSLVDSLLGTLTGLEKKHTVEESEETASRADLGLDPPAATVTLQTEDGEQVLELGGEVPMSQDRVASLAGSGEISVVSGSLWNDVTREPGAWRDRAVIGLASADVDRLEIAAGEGGAGKPVVITRDGEQFRLEAPIADRADRTEVRNLLSDLTGLRAQSFVDDPKTLATGLGLEPPRAVVTLAGGSGEPVRLEVGESLDADLGRYYGRVQGQTFIFQIRDLLDKLERPANAWRSRSWSGLEVFRIRKVRVEDAAGELTVERVDNDWLRDGEKIPYAPVSDLLYAFADVDAERLLTPEQAAAQGLVLGDPELTLEVEAEGFPAETLTVYAATDEGVPARASDRDVVFLLPPEQRTQLDTAVEGVRAAAVEPEPDDSAEGRESGSAADSTTDS